MSDEPLEERVLGDGAPAYYKSGAAYGAARGVSKAAVSKWKKAGHLVFVQCPVTKRHLIDASASDLSRAGAQHPGKVIATATAQQTTGAVEPAGEAPEPIERPESAGAVDVANQTREVTAKSNAKNAYLATVERELRIARTVDRLVDAKQVAQAWKQLGSGLSAALMELGTTVSEEANPGNPRQARMAIEAGMRRVLERFAGDFSGGFFGDDAEEVDSVGGDSA